MPDDKLTIMDMARDFAEGSELAAALMAGVRNPSGPSALSSAAKKRWLELSDWARQRQLANWEQELVASLDEMRRRNEAAELSATETLQRLANAEDALRCVVGYQDPPGTGEVAQHSAETLAVVQEAISALRHAGQARCDYLELRVLIEMAQLRGKQARERYAELSRGQLRASARTFLITILLIFTATMLLHHWMPALR